MATHSKLPPTISPAGFLGPHLLGKQTTLPVDLDTLAFSIFTPLPCLV
jgi:hypothetical protein